MTYVEKVKRYSKDILPKKAVIKAVDECIDEGILKEFFMANRKLIISRDPIDGTIEKREWFARKEGMAEGQAKMIENALRNGKTPEMIAEFIGVSLEYVLEVQKAMLEEA